MENRGRFGKLWDAWDARVRNGEQPTAILREAKDEDLVELLGAESFGDREYARDIIATELLNRLRSRSTSQAAAANAVTSSAQNAHEAAIEGQEAIHRAEGILKESGEWDLGASVSASAYRSLDATEAAFIAAKDSAHHLERSLAQSRAGSELAGEAARVADQGREITERIEGKMDDLGRGEEGRAAGAASRAISKAAEEAAATHDRETNPR